MSEHHDLEIVYQCTDDDEAQIVIGFLASHDIEASIDSNMPHIAMPVKDDSKIYVNSDDAERARQLLAERDAEDAEDLVDEDTELVDEE